MKANTWVLTGLLLLSVGVSWGYRQDLNIQRDINAALRRKLNEQTPCDQAVKESRMLFDKMLKLRKESNETALRGYDNHESFDKQLTTGLY